MQKAGKTIGEYIFAVLVNSRSKVPMDISEMPVSRICLTRK
jgi:hypothetical protein